MLPTSKRVLHKGARAEGGAAAATKSLGRAIVRLHARSFVPSDEGTQAAESGVSRPLLRAQEMEVL